MPIQTRGQASIGNIGEETTSFFGIPRQVLALITADQHVRSLEFVSVTPILARRGGKETQETLRRVEKIDSETPDDLFWLE